MSINHLLTFLTLFLTFFPLSATDNDFLLRPMHVSGDRRGASVFQPGEEVPLSFLPCTFRVTVRARDAGEAWNLLTPHFDQALERLGLRVFQEGELRDLGDLEGSYRIRDSRLYRCGNPGAMARLRQRLLFINPCRESKGWIRQILVGVGPVPDSSYRGPDQNLWLDEYGLRVYIVGRPESFSAKDDLPFDATPLMRDLAQTLAASVR